MGFIHIDIVEYSERLVDKVKRVLDVGFSVLAEAYSAFRDFDPNTAALDELKQHSEAHAFLRFA